MVHECRGKNAWLEIQLFTTRNADSQGVHTEPFSHHEELDKLMQGHDTARQKVRPMVTVGRNWSSPFFFKPRCFLHHPAADHEVMAGSNFIEL
jgi:hypothetical protein